MGDSPQAPQTPDPYATAQAQTGANVQSGIANSIMGNANQVTPYGNVTNAQTGSYNVGGYQIPQFTQTTTLSPQEQQLFNQQTGLGTQENQIASNALGTVGSILGKPINMSGIPSITSSFGTNLSAPVGSLNGLYNVQSNVAPSGNIQNSFSAGGPVQSSIQGYADPNAFQTARDSTTQAMMSRLQPQEDIQREQMQSQLANQGVAQGSDAWNNAMRSVNQSFNDANMQALLAGNQEQQALFGEAAQAGQFANQAQAQQYGENQGQAAFANQAQQQRYGENLSNAQFANSATAQRFGQDLSQAQLANQAQQQGFSEQQLQAQFQNAAEQQAFQQAEQQQLTPLNEITALMSGGQVTVPQSTAFQGGTIAPSPISQSVYNSAGLANQQYLGQLGAYGQQNAGLFGLGGSLLGALGRMYYPSDRRFKRDIVEIGAYGPYRAYAFRYVWDDKIRIGVMADEVVAIAPDAVAANDDGFLMVDYSALAA